VRDDVLDGALDFVTREGAFGVPEPHAEVHAMAARRDTAAREGIEELERLEVRTRRFPNGGIELGPWNAGGENEREVTLDGRKRRDATGLGNQRRE
jgi:hypothetical protein